MRKNVRNLILQSLAVATVSAGAYGVVSVSSDVANAASPTAYSVRGIDTSHHNAHPIRWSAVKASGESFVFQKATQGTSYRDPKFAGDFAAATGAGLMAAPYHFYDSGTGAVQAAHFIRTVKAAGYDGKRPGQLPPVVDLEKLSGRCPAGVNSTQVAAFLTKAKEAFGVNPIVYTSKDFTDTCLRGKSAALANSPLWQPRYKSGLTEPASIGGRYWSIWQYTDRGSVPGISGHVDRNVYKGTLIQLRRLAHLAPTSGKPVPPVGDTTPAPTSKSWPLVKSGSRGTDVRTAQHLLNAAGQHLDADGIFGPATARATKAFQQRNGLQADGIIGPKTWSKLIRTVHQGSTGQAVQAAQVQLAGYGYGIKADGIFGPATARATKAFQQRHGLTVDGIVGPNTWNKLVAGTTTHTPAPAPTTPAHSGNGQLTQRQALAQLHAAGIKSPVGRTSLEGVRTRTIQGVIALKKASGCTITITGGTESGHSTRGTYSHANGYKLDLRTRDEGRCVTAWIKNTQRKGQPRGNDPRWHGTLVGISAEYVYETPRGGGNHWDITFK